MAKRAGKPSFHARVDDGSSDNPKETELDIDIKGVSDADRRDFKNDLNGYSGHHNDRSPSPSERIFEIKIATPKGRVFEGQVSFNATFSESIAMAVHSWPRVTSSA